MKRFLFLVIGLISAALAIIGVFVPGMPTTVFLIVALWAFSQSSTRLHNWLMTAPIFREAMKHIDVYKKHGGVTKNVKITAQLFAWGSVVLVALTSTILLLKIIVALAAIACSITMLSIKTVEES